METNSHLFLETEDPQGDESLKDNENFSAPSSLTEVNHEMPAKRQWAAWTRQEEENFFNALRQVGKNFEKITSRVQSKNKNQVRHYYYRLVRRMNKLLGPGLFDAKNPKDTNAAMLRWWSLLEKHSCAASKLHLKPRRFKMFIEALENQLLKDRNKSRRKRPCQGERCLSTASATTLPIKALGNDGQVILDTQNIPKLETAKGSCLKRNMSANVNCGKGELPPARPVRQKRRPGLIATAAYRRWEKAAMAGVSLVADAAEQLERVTNNGDCALDQGIFPMLSNGACDTAGKKDIDSVGQNEGNVCSSTSTKLCSHQTGVQAQPSVKLKLQLFPIDDITRQALEKDACNPYLELTLSSRKRISSILEHLNRKWCNSSIASGELMLFPYSTQPNINSRRWTAKDTMSSAGEVYAVVGSPAIFRLRYGWFSNSEPVTGIVELPSPLACEITMHSEDFQEGCNVDVLCRESPNVVPPISSPPASYISEQADRSFKDLSIAPPSSPNGGPEPVPGNYPAEFKNEAQGSSGLTPASSYGEGFGREQQEVSLDKRNCGTLSAVEWADSLTNISVGDLLSEASKAAEPCFVDSPLVKGGPCPQENPFSCDSFDAAIAAHISSHQLSRVSTQTTSTSMWNAEETCDEFSFKMVPAFKNKGNSSSHSAVDLRKTAGSVSPFQCYLKELSKLESSNGPRGDVEVELESANDASHKEDRNDPSEDNNLMDIYWPDSLGPLDLEIPSASRYNGQELVFGDSNSFGCLSRLIANSLDVLQNCSFFSDKKESSTSEA